MSSILEILDRSKSYLDKREIEKSRIIAETVVAEALQIDRIMIYAAFEREITEDEKALIRSKLASIVDKSDDEIDIANNNLKNLLDKGIDYLEKNNIEEAKLIAEIIFSHVLKVDRMMLFTRHRDDVKDEEINKIRIYLQKVAKEKFPIQYLLNEQDFYGRKFYVDKGVLIPRQDTEVLVEKAIEILKKIENPKVLDIGTGTGVIGITIALECSDSKVIGVDISDKALEISERNREIQKAENIKFIKSNLFQNIEYRKFDMIISNPPYIPEKEVILMSDDTLLHEPFEALFASNEGLYFYYEISEKAIDYIANDGYLLFEVGHNQGIIVKRIMEEIGYKNVSILNDLTGIGRIVLGQKISAEKVEI